MPDLSVRLVSALRDINFDQRYYGFYDQIRNHTVPGRLSKSDWDRALAEMGLPFRYRSKERFFSTEKQVGGCSVELRVAFRHSEVELILAVTTPGGETGGPFHLLAYQVGMSREPTFSPKPPYPTLPFSNMEQLREIVRFAITLYGDVEQALASSKICPEAA